MTYREVIEKYNDEKYLGIRFEKIKREVGEVINGYSKILNDDREFPSYDSPDYNDLEDSEGISAWSLIDNYRIVEMDEIDEEINSGDISAKYAYILSSDGNLADESCDINEAVYDRPIIIEVIEI